MGKKYCTFQGENNYLDEVGEIIDEGKDYYVINIAKGYYGGGQELWAVKKEEVKLFDSPELASEWIEEQDYYYYDDDYPYGLPPGIERPNR